MKVTPGDFANGGGGEGEEGGFVVTEQFGGRREQNVERVSIFSSSVKWG